MGKKLFVGAVLLEDGDEVLCCGPKDEQDAWDCAQKKKKQLELQRIGVTAAYAFQVQASENR